MTFDWQDDEHVPDDDPDAPWNRGKTFRSEIMERDTPQPTRRAGDRVARYDERRIDMQYIVSVAALLILCALCISVAYIGYV